MGNRQPPPQVPARRRRLRILIGIGVIALAVVVAGYFFGRRQLGELFAGKLGNRLAEDGVFIDWKSADWVPGGGIRLQQLGLYRDAAKRDRLALFGLVTAIRPDPSSLQWDKMNFVAVDTPLLLGSGKDETRMEHMGMLLLVQPRKTDLSECHASVQGLRIEFGFALEFAPPTGTAEAIAAAKLVTQKEGLLRNVNLSWLKPMKERLKFLPEKEEPVLKMKLRSLGENAGQVLAMNFEGERFQWQGLKWDFARAAVTLPIGSKNSRIDIERVHIGYAGRNAEITGAFDTRSRLIHISKFDSGIDLLALARAYDPERSGSLSAVNTSGNWGMSGTAEIPVDHPEKLRGQGSLTLEGDLGYSSGQTKLTLQKPTFSVRLEEQMVVVSNLKAGLWEGHLDAQNIQIDLPSQEKKLRVETELTLNDVHPQSILNSFGETSKPAGVVPWDWKGAWQINGAIEIPQEHPESFNWNGNLALDGELFYANEKTKIALRKPAFALRLDRQAVAISDLKAELWDGNLVASKLQIELPSKEKKLRVETQFTLSGARPQSVRRSFSATRKQAGELPWTWKGTWRISGAGEIPMENPDNFRWSGDVALAGNFVYSSGQTNIALEKPAFSMVAGKKLVTISEFKAGIWEGNLNARKTLIHLPSTNKKLRFETQLALSGTRSQSVRNSFNATRKKPTGAVPWDWKGAWQIDAAGEIPVDHPEKFRWHADAALNGNLVYAKGETNVALQKPSFSVQTEKQLVAISDFKAGLWEGKFNVPKTLIHLSSGKKNQRFVTQFTIADARLQSIINSFGSSLTEPGIVQANWTGNGESDLATFEGSGALSIEGAKFGRMPMLGPLRFIFDNLIPGFNKDESSTMSLNHRLSGGTLFLDDIKLVSQQVVVGAGGQIDLGRRTASLTATGRVRSVPGLLTALLEFKGEGPVDDVHWSLKSIPGLHLIGKAVKNATRSEEEKASDKALKGLLELPGNLVPDK